MKLSNQDHNNVGINCPDKDRFCTSLQSVALLRNVRIPHNIDTFVLMELLQTSAQVSMAYCKTVLIVFICMFGWALCDHEAEPNAHHEEDVAVNRFPWHTARQF
ncbi:hypothetical protein ACROYT_G007035 [Oculina patagonica]